MAPMMDWTDRHCRFFHRLLAPDALLYTEMVTTGALIHGDRERHLAYNAEEHPLALQLGSCEPGELAACATFRIIARSARSKDPPSRLLMAWITAMVSVGELRTGTARTLLVR